MNEDAALAYLAGFFDGEGCVGMYPRYDKTTPKKYLKVVVAQIDERPIRMFQEVFGGNIGIQKSKTGYRNLYRLQYSGDRARDVLANLYPYLTVRREQAALALES